MTNPYLAPKDEGAQLDGVKATPPTKNGWRYLLGALFMAFCLLGGIGIIILGGGEWMRDRSLAAALLLLAGCSIIFAGWRFAVDCYKWEARRRR